jgi:GNAT superfamily N-acetyltransferase
MKLSITQDRSWNVFRFRLGKGKSFVSGVLMRSEKELETLSEMSAELEMLAEHAVVINKFPCLLIEMIWVDEKARGKRLSTFFLAHLVSLLRIGCCVLQPVPVRSLVLDSDDEYRNLHTEELVAYYERLGFVKGLGKFRFLKTDEISEKTLMSLIV